MRVYGVSDLHLDINRLTRQAYDEALHPYHNTPLLNGEHKNDVLLIAGDTAEIRGFRPKDEGTEFATKNRVLKDFEAICAAYKRVIKVVGNHEFYGELLHHGVEDLRGLTKHIDNLFIADNDVIDIEGRVEIIATTLWTDCNKADPVAMEKIRWNLNDYNYIKTLDEHFGIVPIRPQHTVDLYYQNRTWLVDQIERIDPDGTVPVIVMTHHAPIMAHANPQRYGDNAVDYAYAATDLEDVILDNADKVAVYFHGHTHDHKITELGNTVIVTAARGYDDRQYRHQLLLEV